MAERLTGGDPSASAETLRKIIAARYACRLHVAVILCCCFIVGLIVTKAMLVAGVHAMWIRYALALVAGYLAFLLGVRIWLALAGLDRPIVPRRRDRTRDGGFWDGVGSGVGSGDYTLGAAFHGGGGSSGGGGATANWGSGTKASSSSGSVDSDIDVGDAGWVILALIALGAAMLGGAVWLIYSAPTILADAAFAGLLATGLVKSTKHIASGGWVASVIGHTWFVFAIVFVLALAFAIVAQSHFPDARTLGEVLRRL